MFGNTSHLLLVNEDATVDRAIKLPNDRVTNCLQYIIIANQLVIVCNMSFLIVGNENIAQSIPHPLEISDRDNWQMDWSVMDSNTSLLTYYIYLVHAKQ